MVDTSAELTYDKGEYLLRVHNPLAMNAASYRSFTDVFVHLDKAGIKAIQLAIRHDRELDHAIALQIHASMEAV